MFRSASSRSRRLLAAVALVAVGAAVGSVTATAVVIPTFDDVPAEHPFFDEIEWMNATGITNGFPGGTFRPTQPVTRQAMSAFMQRLYDLQEDTSFVTRTVDDSTSSETWSQIPFATTTVVVPAGTVATVTATFAGESYMVGNSSSWGTVRLMIAQDGGVPAPMNPAVDSNFGWDAPGTAEDKWEAHSMTRAVANRTGGHTYTITADFAIVGIGTLVIDDWTLTAETDLELSSYSPE